MKIVAGTDESTIGVEIVPEPIEVQIPTIAIPVQIRHIAIAISIMPDGTNVQNIIYATTL